MNKLLLFLSIILFTSPSFAIEEDLFVQEWFADKEINKIEPYSNYNYTSLKREKIYLSPTEKLSTPKNVKDGQIVNLVVKRNARLGKELLKKGTPAQAIVELYTTNGMSGIQGTITLGQIEIKGVDSDKLYYYLVKEGQNRTLWLLPIKWGLTFIPFVGTITNIIKGGQAVISPADTFTVYYYPER